jgi:beta-phosphoglucomutase-like phosphatase (HAD superfamily)
LLQNKKISYCEALKMAKVILFDLDGTLLPMDTQQFITNYIKELAPRVGILLTQTNL